MKKTHLTHLIGTVLLCAAANSSAQNVISMNFDGQGGTGTPGPVTGVAGSVPVANWNNSGVSGLTGPLALVDDSGAATGASVNWTVGNQWTTNGGDNVGTDAQMMQGYLDNFHSQPPMTVTGIPASFTAAGYELRIYHNTDSGGTMGFTVDDGNGPTTYYSHQPGGNDTNYPLAGVDPFGGAAGYIGSQDTNSGNTNAANYTLFTGLSGATLTITGVAGTAGDSRSRPNGFQIVANVPIVDADMDGLDDSWEIANGLDPTDDGSVDINNGPDGDPDGDTLLNKDEFDLGTHPNEADTDMDGLDDNVEDKGGVFVSAGMTGTDPLLADTDGDTLEDGEEIELNPFFSDPNLVDTDGDGLDDASEVAANPFVTDPGSQDTDGDGVTDPVELALGSDPTDPSDKPTLGGGKVISVNFDGQSGVGTPGPVTGVAGSIPVAGWNNSGVSGLSGPLALFDDSGAPTGASVNWTVGNQWTTSGGDNAGTDAQMMQGYLDNFHTQPPMTVTGIPASFTAAGYELRIYHNTDSGGTMGFTVDDGNGPTTYYSHQPGGNDTNYPLAGVDPFGGAAGYIGSQDTAANTTTPSNYTLFTGLSGSTLTITGVAGSAGDGRSRPNGFQIVSLEPDLPPVITSLTRNADGTLRLTWTSKDGKSYKLRSRVDPSIDLPIDWPVHDGHENIVATVPENVLVIPHPGDSHRFFVIEEFNPPPPFSEDFEGGAVGWTSGSDGDAGTLWELGAPTVVGPLSANGGTNCFGTNIADNFGINADVWLRSPDFSLAGVSTAVLEYFQHIDTDDLGGDLGSITVHDASDDSVIEVIADDISGIPVQDWEQISYPLPAAAIGVEVYLVFRFTSNEVEEWAGWYIDDIIVR